MQRIAAQQQLVKQVEDRQASRSLQTVKRKVGIGLSFFGLTFDLPDQVAQIVHGDFLLPYERRNHPEVGIVEILAHHALQRLAAELLLADERIILVGAAIGLVSDVPFRLEATHHRR